MEFSNLLRINFEFYNLSFLNSAKCWSENESEIEEKDNSKYKVSHQHMTLVFCLAVVSNFIHESCSLHSLAPACDHTALSLNTLSLEYQSPS